MRCDPVYFRAAVEGPTDEAILRRIVEYLGGILLPAIGKTGKSAILNRLDGLNRAAQFQPWIVLVDLDRDADCAPSARAQWLPMPSQYMWFRIAVREIESWLLADRETLARFLAVPMSKVPEHPEMLSDPKGTMVDLARHSRQRAMMQDMVPRADGGRSVGPAYSSRMIEYAQGPWRPDVAARRADSLGRLCARVTAYMEGRNQ
jgi:hypothetical protein